MNFETDDKLHLDIYQEILKIKSAFQSQYGKNVEILDSEIEERSRENRHLLDVRNLKFEDSILNPFCKDMLSIPLLYEAFDKEDIHRLSDELEEVGTSWLLKLFLHKDWQNLVTLSKKRAWEQDLLLFVGLNLTQAVLELYAEKLKSKIDQEGWLKGICPVCGNLPALAKLKAEDGKRILWCGWCGTEWHFKRMMCPFCGNEDHNSLRFFFVEDDSPAEKDAYRVDVCDRCRKYVKTLDERKLPKGKTIVWPMENLNTVFLDLLGRKDGYTSSTFWMLELSVNELICQTM